MTGRCRWLLLMAMAGAGLGLFRSQTTLAWLSLTVLIWIFLEWVRFHTRLWFELPRLTITRTINGSSQEHGYLWAGRVARVEIKAEMSSVRATPILLIDDCLPENVGLNQGHHRFELLTRESSIQYSYAGEVRGAGVATFPGFRLTLMDPQRFFTAERFVPCEHLVQHHSH